MFCNISGNKADLIIKTESIIKIEATPQKEGSDWQVRVVHEESQTTQFVIVHEDSEEACKELVAGIRETIIRETPSDHLSLRNETITNVRQEWKKAAQQGDADAQYQLGVMYDKSYGIEQDYREAVKWYTKAAQQGHAGAQYNLGWMYYTGFGVEKDDREAHKWWAKAAQQGDAVTQGLLGLMYKNGFGVEMDYCEAHKWLTLAAEQGNEDARKARDELAQQMSPDQIA